MRPGVWAGGRGCLIGALFFVWAGAFAEARQVKEAKCPMGRQYFLFTPDRIVPQQTYWLVVNVHGFGGSGSASDSVGQWVDQGDCIAISPSFPSPEFPLLGSESDRQLVGCFKQLKEQYKLHAKLFIMGHSGGSQYAHRFMMKYPHLVVGCCATSGGSWATGGGWDDINPAAATIPLAMSCGLLDTEKMAAGAPWGRLEWARRFEAQLKRDNYLYKARYWPNAGHGGDPAGNAQLAAEAFSLGVSGMLDTERAALDSQVVQAARVLAARGQTAADAEIKKARDWVNARTANSVTTRLAAAGWQVSAESVAVLLQTAPEYLEGRLAILDVLATQGASSGTSGGLAGGASAGTGQQGVAGGTAAAAGQQVPTKVIVNSDPVAGRATVAGRGAGLSPTFDVGQPAATAGRQRGPAKAPKAKPADDPLAKLFKNADGVAVLTAGAEPMADRNNRKPPELSGVVVVSLKGNLKRGAAFRAAIPSAVTPQVKLPGTEFVLVAYRLVNGNYEITVATEASDAQLRIAAAATGTTPQTTKSLRAITLPKQAVE